LGLIAFVVAPIAVHEREGRLSGALTTPCRHRAARIGSESASLVEGGS
jgi:hypothetical protein